MRLIREKMGKIFIKIICMLLFICQFGYVHADIGDIGHWRDGVGGQIPGTTFGGFNMNTQIRNDGIYTKPNDSTIQVTEAGDYMVITTTHDADTSNGRYNSQLKISQIAGTGDIFSTHNTGFSRDNSENESWTRGVGIIIGASANSQFQVQKRRDTDTPTGGSVINSSDIQIVRLNQTNYGIYNIGGTGNIYGGTTPNTADITNISNQSNTASIEGNITSDTITVKGDNKTYLVAWSMSFDSGNTRTQRIGHLEYNNVDSLSTRSYCYNRNAANEYCGLGSMDIIRTSTADINIQTEIYRGDGVLVDQGGADDDGNLATDGNGQLIVLEMPDYLEVFSSHDSVGLQDIISAQTLNIARDIKINDATSFTKASNTTVNVTNPSDIFSWANIWTARSDVSSGQRQTSYGSIVINGVEQTTGRHGNYSRGNQGTIDTFAMSFHPAGIFTTIGAGNTIGVNSNPLAGGESGGNDRTQAGTLGFFSINLDTLIAPIVDPKPGGVGNNLQVWLKADSGPNNTTDGGNVTSWLDRSGNGFNATTGVAPIYRNGTTTQLNFNPVVDFNGTNQYLQNLNNGAYTQSYFLVIVPDNSVSGTSAGQVPYGFNCNSGILNIGTCGLNFAGVTLGAFTAAFNDEVITQAIGSSASWRAAQLGLASYAAGKPMLIGMNENSTGNGTDIYEKGISLKNFEANTYQSVSATDFALGRSLDNTYPFYYDGKIAEIINFNSRVSDTERNKIESYLSLKYGITLQSGTQNYISTDGTTIIWSSSLAGSYNNDIFGIGRDGLTELGQVKSKSSNSDNVITLEAVGEGTNLVNNFVDISDKEFLTISNNNAGNTWTAVGAPSGYYNLSRSWRVQETGEVGTVNLDFDVGNTSFDIPNLSVGTNYYFVYDSDNDDSLSDEVPIAMTNISTTVKRVSGINLNHLREFTIATQASTNNIPTNITLSNSTVNENIAANSIVGTLSTTDLDSGDTHTYSLVNGAGSSDNGKVTLTGNTIRLIYSPDFEIKPAYSIRVQTSDGAGGQYQKALTINVNNIGEVISSIVDFEINDKYSITSGNWIRDGADVNQGSNSLRSNIEGIASTQACFIVSHTFANVGTVEFDYKVSSQTGGDFLRFYIDNVEQQIWSGTVNWARYSKNNVTAGLHEYKWCYIKDGNTNAGNDRSVIDYITFQSNITDITPPTVTGTNFVNNSLLPGGNHNIRFNYFDSQSGINTSSDNINVNKWNGSSWGTNISATALNLGSKTVTATQASYPTNNLAYGRYRFTFNISDNDGNISSSNILILSFDKPSITISTGSLDIGKIIDNGLNFSNNEIIITINTLGAGFNVRMSQDNNFIYGGETIINWNGVEGIGYDKTTYSGTNLNINSNPNLYTQSANLNVNGNYNTYVYRIKIGTLIGELQAAGNYETNLSFYLYLNY